MNCADVQEIRDLYLLGALATDEREDLELHLEECPSCQADVKAAWSAAQLLRLAAPQVSPPPSLKGRLLERASEGFEEDRTPSVGTPRVVSLARGSGRLQMDRISPVRGRTLSWASALAAALPLAVAGWFGLQVVQMQERLAETEAALRQTSYDARVVAELLGRGIQAGPEMAHVEGTEMAPDASGMFYYGRSSSEGVLVVSGLPSLPRDQTYQLWLVSGHDRMNGGTFGLEDGGKGLLMVKAPMPIASVDSIAVTMEPMGGSSTPRGAGYMHGVVRLT